jgi:hypothetical protein
MIKTLAKARKAHPLAAAVLRQLGGGREALEQAIEAGRHGADAGWPGFTFYDDTVGFTRRHRAAICGAVEQLAADLGEEPIAMVRGFRCLGGDISHRAVSQALWGGRGADKDEVEQVENALAWWALEEVGRALADD